MMTEMTELEKRFYMMKLHEKISLDNKYTVLRVPGGWIYYNHIETTGENIQQLASTSVFVPFNNEFNVNVEFVGRKGIRR
ncbi:MAG: hypothetical protein ABIL62_05330 [Planctomycetota bacterium]